MSESQEFFNELLYGEGAWLGLLLILSIVILVSLRDKRASILFIPLTLFMGLSYLTNVSANSNFMWASLIMFVAMVFLIIRLAKGK